MWEVISVEINKIHSTSFNASHCENRWRVIERNYKKFVDETNKTGRGRKLFEYTVEMEEIFGNKKNINPELLLSNETVHHDSNLLEKRPLSPLSFQIHKKISSLLKLKNVRLEVQHHSEDQERKLLQKIIRWNKCGWTKKNIMLSYLNKMKKK